jgi:hypothetical protein
MTATVVLCVLSTLSFCLCLRGLVGVMANARDGVSSFGQRFGFSRRARRFARSYATFALVVMGLASFIGAIKSYIELFN